MEIALLNAQITFQKNEVTVDAVGNHRTAWRDYYSCHATLGGENANKTEQAQAGTTVDHGDASFTVRWCAALRPVTATGYRIAFEGELFDIISIDHRNLKKKSLKFYCRKVRR